MDLEAFIRQTQQLKPPEIVNRLLKVQEFDRSTQSELNYSARICKMMQMWTCEAEDLR